MLIQWHASLPTYYSRTGTIIPSVARDEDGFEDFQEVLDGNQIPTVLTQRKYAPPSTPHASGGSRRSRLSLIDRDDDGSGEAPMDLDDRQSVFIPSTPPN